jgi:hypothetical protein
MGRRCGLDAGQPGTPIAPAGAIGTLVHRKPCLIRRGINGSLTVHRTENADNG